MPVKRKITPTEALYGFFSWIIKGSRKHILGGGHHGGMLHSELANFCEVNNLSYLEDGWESNVVLPRKFKMKKLGSDVCRKGFRNNG